MKHSRSYLFALAIGLVTTTACVSSAEEDAEAGPAPFLFSAPEVAPARAARPEPERVARASRGVTPKATSEVAEAASTPSLEPVTTAQPIERAESSRSSASMPEPAPAPRAEPARLAGEVRITAGALFAHALTLESEDRYSAALTVYDRLLELTPEYRDATLRRSTLAEFVALAETSYRAAGEARRRHEAEAEAFHLRTIGTFWPEYRDVDERLRVLGGDGSFDQ